VNILKFLKFPMFFNENRALKFLARAALTNLESSSHKSSIELLVRIFDKALDVKILLYFGYLILVKIKSVDFIVIESLL
jgi:hypothetical protein